LTDSDNVKIRY